MITTLIPQTAHGAWYTIPTTLEALLATVQPTQALNHLL